MDFSTILTVATYIVSTLAFVDGLRLIAQAPVPGGDWTGGTTSLVAGVLGLVLMSILRDIMKVHQAKQDRDAAKEARESRVAELQSNLETARIRLAVALAELGVWKAHCPSQPSLAKIRAAQTRARNSPGDYVDDSFTSDEV